MERNECVLVIRNFPRELPIEYADELCSNFGSLRTIKQSKKNAVYATFPCRSDAEVALSRLHQLQVLNRRLVVEYADDGGFNCNLEAPSRSTDLAKDGRDDGKGGGTARRSDLQEKLQEFSRNLNAVGKAFGLDYPMSAKLFYSYPRPTASTLHNIRNALLAVPKFYFQVLHLMNKMNLPAPFGPALHFPELSTSAVGASETLQCLDDEESELESDTDETARVTEDLPVVEKRRRPSNRLMSKRPRLQQAVQNEIVEPILAKDSVRPDEVFDLPASQMAKKIEFKLDAACFSTPTDTDGPSKAGFGTFEPAESLECSGGESSVEASSVTHRLEKKFVREEELASNRIPREELEMLPVFKNYDAGKPTRRLYLKNLAKHVVEDDLTFIYGRYVDERDEQDTFDIRLMKEGRMKGQAFVTLMDEDRARLALQQTNGYVLHGKPIVVQFAKGDRGATKGQ